MEHGSQRLHNCTNLLFLPRNPSRLPASFARVRAFLISNFTRTGVLPSDRCRANHQSTPSRLVPAALAVQCGNRIGYRRALPPFLDKSEKDFERHWRLPTAGMVEKYTRQRVAPTVQQGDQPALRDVRR